MKHGLHCKRATKLWQTVSRISNSEWKILFLLLIVFVHTVTMNVESAHHALALIHAVRRWRHCWTAAAMMSWSRAAHSVNSVSYSCVRLEIRVLYCYIRSCRMPRI